MGFTSHFSAGCLFLLAMAAMWHGVQGQERELLGLSLNLNLGLDICGMADYPVLCRSVVKGLTNPFVAIESAIRQLMLQTKMGMAVAQQCRKSPAMDVCYETYDDAFSSLETSLSNLRSRDKRSLNINLSAALTDYVTCDDAVADGGTTSSITRTNLTLRQMAINCLYLSSLIRLR